MFVSTVRASTVIIQTLPLQDFSCPLTDGSQERAFPLDKLMHYYPLPDPALSSEVSVLVSIRNKKMDKMCWSCTAIFMFFSLPLFSSATELHDKSCSLTPRVPFTFLFFMQHSILTEYPTHHHWLCKPSSHS